MSIKARQPQSSVPGSINGTMYGSTCYGDVMPGLCGRFRIPPKMIWAANHRQAKSGKKLKQSKKKGSQPAYAQNVDFLLASTKLFDIQTIYRNKDVFGVTLANETGTVDGSGNYQLTSTPSGQTVIAIVAVLLNGTYNVTISDYQGPDPGRNYTGAWQTPLYRKESLVAPVFNSVAVTGWPWPNIWSGSSFVQTRFPVISFPSASLIGASIEVFFVHADSTKLPMSQLNLVFEATLANNAAIYTPNPAQQLSYSDCAGVGSTALDLGTTDSVPSYGFETTGNFALTKHGECDPADILQYIMGAGADPLAGFAPMLTIMDSFFRSTHSTKFLGDLTQLRNFSRANGIFLTRYFDTQQAGRDYMQEILDSTNSETLWSEHVLKFIPRSEVSAFGNGSFYQPDCSFGPKFDFGRNSLISERGKPAFTIERVAQNNVPNILPIEHIDVTNEYNTAVTTWQDQLDVYQNGATQDSTKTLHCVMQRAIAQQVGSMLVKRNVASSRNTYKFTVSNRFATLEPMDVVTLSDEDFGFYKIPVRLLKISDQYPSMNLDCEAEDFFYAANSPVGVSVAATQAQSNTTNSPPGNVTDYVIFDLPPKLKTTASQVELGVGLCSTSASWGGAAVYISNDNTNFTLAGTVQGGSTMGKLTLPFPSHVDPDTVDTLTVDFSESDGQPISATTTTRDQFQSLMVIQDVGGSFELVAYASVALVTGDTYAFTPTIRRGIYATPPGLHSVGATATLIDSTILHVGLAPQFIGQTLYFKFCSFNSYGQEQQSLADVTSVTYTPNGAASAGQQYTINPNNPLTQGTGANINKIIAAPFSAAFTSGTVSYLGATMTIATPTAPTDYFVTVFDPGQIGDSGGNPALTYSADTTNAHATSTGYTYLGKITVLPTGGATGGQGGSAGSTTSSPSPGVAGTYQFTRANVGGAWTGTVTNPNNILDGDSTTFAVSSVSVPPGPTVPTAFTGGPVASVAGQQAPLGPLSPTSITVFVDFEVTQSNSDGTPSGADEPFAWSIFGGVFGGGSFSLANGAIGAGPIARNTVSLPLNPGTLVSNITLNQYVSMPWNATTGGVSMKIYGMYIVVT